MGTAAEHGRRHRWRPVRQRAADTFWLLLIVSSSLTVLGTRVFLELTGYPRIGGGGQFHIAHVLWGGLLLFGAVVLPLSLANRYALWASAILGGVGTGLFIDEVGKFITSSTDYFAPLAFPIIYGFTVACIWLAYRIARHRPRDTRTLLYHALEDMKQVLDDDLDPFEHRELVAELRAVVANAKDPNERRLGEALLAYATSRDIRLSLAPNLIERMLVDLRSLLSGWPPRLLLRALLLLGFGLLGVNALLKIGSAVSLAQGTGPLAEALEGIVVRSGTTEYTLTNPGMFTLMTLATVAVGLLALATSILLLVRRERLALRIGVLALVFSLTLVAPITFYFNQLYAIIDVGGQLVLLGFASLYRWRFLSPAYSAVAIGDPDPASVHGASAAGE